ncbi:Bacterial regulatory protein, tetR family [compost metagenome]
MSQGKLNIDHLLTTAAAEFAAHGFEGMSLRVLAEKCAVTQPAIYYHFSSKEELYEEVCSLRFDEIASHIARQVAAARCDEERLIEFVSVLYDEWHRDATLLLLTQREVMNALIDSRQCVAGQHYTFLLTLIRDVLGNYLGGAIDRDFAFTFGSMLFGYCSMMSFDRLDYDGDRERYLSHRKSVLLNFVRQTWGTGNNAS